MLEKKTIARPYAESAFSQALEEGQLQNWATMLKVLRLIVADDNMTPVLTSPKLDHQQLAQFIIDIAGDVLNETGRNFVHILVDAGRISLIAEIVVLFEEKQAAAEAIDTIEVTSAYPLTDPQINMLTKTLAKNLGKKIDINAKEDKGLIGGVVIRMGDTVINASVQGRLKELNNLFV